MCEIGNANIFLYVSDKSAGFSQTHLDKCINLKNKTHQNVGKKTRGSVEVQKCACSPETHIAKYINLKTFEDNPKMVQTKLWDIEMMRVNAPLKHA